MNDMQQTPQTPSNQERATKGLAVLGFLGLLIGLAWLIFIGVGYLPTLINNMATVIQSEATYELSTYPLEDSVSHNSTIGVEWNTVDANGTYEFSYSCVDGVTVEIRTAEQGIQDLACDTPYDVGTRTGVDLTVRSTSERFVDIPYTVSFVPEDTAASAVDASDHIAVFNPAISILGAEDETEPVATSTPSEEEREEDDSSVDEVTTEEPSSPAPSTPATTPTYVTQYTIPVSDPNGTTNLRLHYLGVGTLNSDNQFTPRAHLPTATTGAIRVAVTNNGTRTSDSWTYSTTLPNGQEYTSSRQAGLKPNETATLVLGFRTGDDDGMHPFAVSIDTDRDTNRNDDELRWSVEVR